MGEATTALDIPEIRALLDLLRSRIRTVLGENLVGLYVVGSLVVGDFDVDVSDIDLIALTATDLSEDEATSLKTMHAAVVSQHPGWDDRIEVIYVAFENLKRRPAAHQIAVISPGEPFHVFGVRGSDWLINWYVLYEYGIPLFGAPPRAVVAPVPLDDLLPALRRQLAELPQWFAHKHQRKAQAYMILTLCRALCLFAQHTFASKRQAALWAAAEFPQWSLLIRQALVWRTAAASEPDDHGATLPETRRFVDFALDKILSSPST